MNKNERNKNTQNDKIALNYTLIQNNKQSKSCDIIPK